MSVLVPNILTMFKETETEAKVNGNENNQLDSIKKIIRRNNPIRKLNDTSNIDNAEMKATTMTVMPAMDNNDMNVTNLNTISNENNNIQKTTVDELTTTSSLNNSNNIENKTVVAILSNKALLMIAIVAAIGSAFGTAAFIFLINTKILKK